ncbi:DNA methyltransferase [Mycobacterium phage EleanorGeorge]|uniref:DNA methylase n=1 Tax=Mycobacterium phage EleanorGeorge TaxID=2301563 RepID=A0A385DNB9_9CAUD|nr:DNA methyltransferase [Mycobacterium phage EleanorGeorge]AXQ60774.1 DNA methylase [Mycobacterium phage EleanorGeorge]
MLTLLDMFCGAGGSSTGAVQVPGIEVRVAANHWKLAVETHGANHPTTDHICADLSQIDPRLFPNTDILWASPSCTIARCAAARTTTAGAPAPAPDTNRQRIGARWRGRSDGRPENC